MADEPWKEYAPAATTPDGPWAEYQPPTPNLPLPTQAAPATPDSGDGDFMRGFKRTLPELKQLVGGTLAAAGDVTGLDSVRDYGLGVYKAQEDKLAPLQRPNDSASEAYKQVKQGNLGAGVDFLQNAAGYTAGQALESLAAAGAGAVAGGIAGGAVTAPVGGEGSIIGAPLGAIGGFVAKQGVKRLVKQEAEKLVAEQVAKGVAKSEAKKLGAQYVAEHGAKDVVAAQVGKRSAAELTKLGGKVAGGALGAQGLNAVMEVGSVYPDAYNQAQAEGRDLTTGEKAKAVGASLAAAGLETVADLFNLGVLFKGVKDVGHAAARDGLRSAAKAYAGRAAVAGTEGALREAGTEGAQTFLERVGANQSLDDADAIRDYVDSAAVGAVGGVLFGAGAALHANHGNDNATIKPLGKDPNDKLRAAVVDAQASGDPAQADAAVQDLHDALVKEGRVQPQDYTPPAQGYQPAPIGYNPPAINPAAGPLSRVAAQVPFPDAQPGTLASAANAVVPAHVDAATGEYLPPSDDALKAQLHSVVEQQIAGQGRIVRTKAIQALQGIVPRRAQGLFDQVMAERKQGITSAQYEAANGPANPSPSGQAAEPAAVADGGHGGDSGTLAGAVQHGAADAVLASPEAQPATGDVAPAQDAAPADLPAAGAQAEGLTYNTSSQLEDGDVTPPSGEPFTHERAAQIQASRHEGGKVFPVEGGFVVRVPTARPAEAVSNPPAGTESAGQTSPPTQSSQPESPEARKSQPPQSESSFPSETAPSPSGQPSATPAVAGGAQAAPTAPAAVASGTIEDQAGVPSAPPAPKGSERPPAAPVSSQEPQQSSAGVAASGQKSPSPESATGPAGEQALSGEFVPHHEGMDTYKFLSDAPVGHVAAVEGGFGIQGADGAVRWTKQANGDWSDGKNTVTTAYLTRVTEEGGPDNVLEGQATRVKKQAALPAPAARQQATAPAPAAPPARSAPAATAKPSVAKTEPAAPVAGESKPASGAEGASAGGEQSVKAIIGRIAEGEHPSTAIRELNDAGARAAANALGFKFAKTAKAANIANMLGEGSQVDLRRAADRAYAAIATPEDQAARMASRPARNDAANAKVARQEQEADLRRRERAGVITRDGGQPFKTAGGARAELARLPDRGDFARDDFGVAKQGDGFVMRRLSTDSGTGALAYAWVGKDTERAKTARAAARQKMMAERGLVADAFGNLSPAPKSEPAKDETPAKPAPKSEAARQASKVETPAVEGEATELTDADLTPAERESLASQKEGAQINADLREAAAQQARDEGEEDAKRGGYREAIARVLGPKQAARVKFSRGYEGLPENLRNGVESRNAERDGKVQTSALYDPDTQQVYLFTDVIKTADRAAFNAAHEIAGHDGLRKLLGPQLDRALEIGLQNPAVRKLAEAIARDRSIDIKSQSGRLLAAEEALAELAAAVGTGDYAHIESRYGVEVPEGMRSSLGRSIENFLRRLKELLNDLFGRPVFSDEDVRGLLDAAREASKGEGATDGKMAEQTVYHGTTHRGIEKFSLNKIGTGEGAQAYGWGMYFASSKDIAEHYRTGLSTRDFINKAREAYDEFDSPEDAAANLREIDGLSEPQRELIDALKADDWLGFDYPHQAIQAALRTPQNFELSPETQAALKKQGQTYQVDVPEDSDLLAWDKPLSEQPEKVQAGIAKVIADGALDKDALREWNAASDAQKTGKRFYTILSQSDHMAARDGAQGASEALNAAGIPGLRYLDGNSRNKGAGSHNYVIWDEAAIGQPQGLLESTEASKPSILENVEPANLNTMLGNAGNSVRGLRLPAGYLLGDLMGATKGGLSWWHKTVGTQFNLAQRYPAFKAVFDSAQRFIDDTSYYASEAADLAPHLLPKLNGIKDVFKQPVSAADTLAIADPIYQGTLNWTRNEAGEPVEAGVDEAGIVWTDPELRERFGLNDHQIGLYREFRASIDKSLNDLFVAQMVNYGGEDTASVRQQAIDAGTVQEVNRLLTKHLRDEVRQLGEANAALKQQADDLGPTAQNSDRAKDISAEMNRNYARASSLQDTAKWLDDQAERFTSLTKMKGYAPLSRFGRHFLYVRNARGEQLHFQLFDSARDANKAARAWRDEPDAFVEQGTMSQEAFKRFQGITPETLELFGDMLGLDPNSTDPADQAFQAFLKLSKSNRSAMKRLIHRKGIAGFSTDSGRVLASFIVSNARLASGVLHNGETARAIENIPKHQGELKDAAIRLASYVRDPQEEAHGLRAFTFAQYLGGSIAAAMVNMTQSITMTFPYLSQYGGAVKAAKELKNASVDALKRTTGDAALDAAIAHGEEEGFLAPQEIHQLQAQARGASTLRSGDGTTAGDALAHAHNAMAKTGLAWGKVFSVAEAFNRRVAFIAAYRLAQEQGMRDPAGFARNAVDQTQGIYSKGNKPRWARGAVGGTLFTFKQFGVSYVELLHRMATRGGPEGKKAALLGLGVMFLMAGASGIPGADDLDDLIDGLLQRLGYNASTKQARIDLFARVFGQGGAQFLEHGVSGIAGVPIDVSGRLGMGNLIPGTGLLLKKEDHSRDLTELVGPVGDLASRTAQAADSLVQGKVGEAARLLSPRAVNNLMQAVDMASTGMYRDSKGRKVIDTTATDAFAKAIGYQPNNVARVQQASSTVQQMIAVNKMVEREIADQWAEGLFENDPGKVADARDQMLRWNARNPQTPIRINPAQLKSRLRSMRMSKSERLQKTAPREIRANVTRGLLQNTED